MQINELRTSIATLHGRDPLGRTTVRTLTEGTKP
jgi:hypothetical protein